MEISETTRAVVREALRSLAPGDAESRLRWLLDLSERDLTGLTDDDWSHLQVQMLFILMRWEWDRRDSFAGFVGTLAVSDQQKRGFRRLLQPQLSALFRALANEDRHEVHLPRRGAGHWVISRRKTATGRIEAEAHFLGYVWLQLVLLAVRLLDEVGAPRLKTCPFRKNPDTPQCGRLFIATRRQKFCSTKESRAVAFQKWLDTHHGGTRAKGDATVPAIGCCRT
ncbi:MAG: hypothetical protein ACREVS_13745 [Burkholderiales bacterium]